jgi:glycosyltransferase involved in cell wall biosynthesis
MLSVLLPVSAIIATRDRAMSLSRMLKSLGEQTRQPQEIIVVDASADSKTRTLCEELQASLSPEIIYRKAEQHGAAIQRNQGIPLVSTSFVLFCDDDIVFEPECIERLWHALLRDPALGGVNAMIINQKYVTPGFVTRVMLRMLHGKYERTYAGKCIGPALNLLPEDGDELPEVVAVEWLNTTCTLYRREALPSPPFADVFSGYSLMEDVALSLTVGRGWKLANARTARIIHDSQPGSHKSDPIELARMSLTNRHYVMTQVLGRRRPSDYLPLAAWLVFSHAAALANARERRYVMARLRGEWRAIRAICAHTASPSLSAPPV